MRALTRSIPRDLARFPFDSFFDRFFKEFGEEFFAPTTSGEWYPSMDLLDEKDRLVARLEVPGIDPKDVEVTLEGDTLTVSGERKEEKESEKGDYISRETTFGSFRRTVTLPYHVEKDKVKATYKNGIMTIAMPKSAEVIGRQIPVEVK